MHVVSWLLSVISMEYFLDWIAQPCHFLDSHGDCVFTSILFFFLVGSHISLAWVELLDLEALVGQTLWNPCNTVG